MINEKSYALGANRSVIRDLFEYGRQRAAIVGAENVYDYSLGNPSIPAPDYVNQAIRDILSDKHRSEYIYRRYQEWDQAQAHSL